MALDNAQYPSELDINAPANNEDVGEADDQIRTAKRVVNQGFPNVAGAVSATDVELSYVTGVTSSIQTQLDNILETGTKVIFPQAAAPSGWTLDATHNDKALRIVSGAGGGSGGSSAFSTEFNGSTTSTLAGDHTHTITVASHALTITEMPTHSHGGLNVITNSASTGVSLASPGGNPVAAITPEGSGGGHGHPGSGATGVSGHSHSVAFDVTYVDSIICTRD